MSLRRQIFLSVVVSLLIALFAEGAIALREARHSVENEMHKALETSDRMVDNALLSLPQQDRQAYLIRLVRSFDDNRHIRVKLQDHDAKTIAVSHIAPPEDVPSWFRDFLETPSETRFDWAQGLLGSSIIVSTDPHNEIAETWGQFRDGASVLVLLDLMVLALLYLILRRTVRPLEELRSGFASLGQGRYDIRVKPGGTDELAGLARAFNQTVQRLGRLELANARLSEQMATIQEEERADLVRDLHDEMGPFLFAMRMDAEHIERIAKANPEIGERAHAIGESVSHMQRHLREILRRLRTDGVSHGGLVQAITNLVAFWKRYNPKLDIILDIPPLQDDFSEDVENAIFRTVQEGLMNVVRHGGATKAQVCMVFEAGQISVCVEDNGRGIAAGGSEGQGISGMRERLALLGGSLEFQSTPGCGTRLLARLPVGKAALLASVPA
jgi:two-component system, NarL family, sensor histidine kinase UhpB